MKKFFISILAVVFVFALVGCGKASSSTEESSTESGEKEIKVGIIQIVEHPALDAAREGFLETLNKNGYEEGKNLKIDYQNAQGDQTVLQSIAQKFAADKPDLVLAIATPSAQAMASASKDIPIIITAVTDPVAANLVKSADKPGTNVTGTNDMNPIKEQFELINTLVPEAKNIGVIYNAGEVNSEIQVKLAKDVADKLSLELVEATVASSAEVLQAARSLVGKVDAIYVPTDNMVVSAAESVVQVTSENKIPLFAGESSVIEKGGLATIGVNYKKLGQQTGEIAIRVVKGENPQDIAIESQKDVDTIVNKKTADQIGITIPASILEKAATVIK